MSYSFSARGTSKNLALCAAVAAMAQMTATQPIHAHDTKIALDNAERTMDAIAEPAEGKQVVLTMSGYVSWSGADGGKLTGVNSSISVGYEDLPPVPDQSDKAADPAS